MPYIVFLLIATTVMAQSRWQDYFSYKNVSHVLELNGILYAATENGIFTYDPQLGEIQKRSKVNDLNAVGITAFNYNQENDLILVGYQTGEMDLIAPNEVYNFIDIPLDDFQGSKQVNHLTSSGNSMIISGEFGVVTFDLNRLEFDETAFFRENGVFIEVNETAVLNDFIFAATENGIYVHPLNDFIPNFPAWEQPTNVPNSNFVNILEFNGNIFAATNNQVYQFDGTDWSLFQNLANIQDLNANNNVLSISLATEIRNFDANLNPIENISIGENINTAISFQSTSFAGTQNSGLRQATNNNSFFPDGPFNNLSYAVTAYNGQIFILPGGANNYNAPRGNTDGYSHFNTTEWIHNTFQELNNARDVIHATVNPTDTTEVWISTWNQSNGLLKMKSGELEVEYSPDNSALEELDRIGGSTFDSQGTLWVSQSFTQDVHHLVSFDSNGNSTGYNLLSVISDTSPGVNAPIVDTNDNVFIPATRDGGVIIRTTNGDLYNIANVNSGGDLPSGRVRSIAIDQNNVLWIATIEGLRIKSNPISAIEQSDDFSTEAIIIEQNGIAEELFFEVPLTDVVVDGANRKWIATEAAGVFYLSEDGQETLLNFNTANSPLPSNNVTDVAVDPFTGIVYFATGRGVVSYRSDAIISGDSFGKIEAYPNPVRPGFTGNVVIRGLANNADVRITDVVGNLMFRGTANGGIIEWNTNNLQGVPVASGVYLVLMTNQDASETAYTKIAIVR